MKRIISPQVSRTMILGDDSVIMEKEEPKHSFESEGLGVPQEVPPKEVPCKEVPPKELFGSNLKNLNGYREMRKKIKLERLEAEFIQQTSSMLNLFHTKEKHYDYKCVQYIVQLAEDYFVSHPKLGEIKERAVVASIKKFYNDDDELVKSIIQMVLPSIKKSTLMRRTANNVVFFLSAIVSILLGK
jgi:hypothetical protein